MMGRPPTPKVYGARLGHAAREARWFVRLVRRGWYATADAARADIGCDPRMEASYMAAIDAPERRDASMAFAFRRKVLAEFEEMLAVRRPVRAL